MASLSSSPPPKSGRSQPPPPPLKSSKSFQSTGTEETHLIHNHSSSTLFRKEMESVLDDLRDIYHSHGFNSHRLSHYSNNYNYNHYEPQPQPQPKLPTRASSLPSSSIVNNNNEKQSNYDSKKDMIENDYEHRPVVVERHNIQSRHRRRHDSYHHSQIRHHDLHHPSSSSSTTATTSTTSSSESKPKKKKWDVVASRLRRRKEQQQQEHEHEQEQEEHDSPLPSSPKRSMQPKVVSSSSPTSGISHQRNNTSNIFHSPTKEMLEGSSGNGKNSTTHSSSSSPRGVMDDDAFSLFDSLDVVEKEKESPYKKSSSLAPPSMHESRYSKTKSGDSSTYNKRSLSLTPPSMHESTYTKNKGESSCRSKRSSSLAPPSMHGESNSNIVTVMRKGAVPRSSRKSHDDDKDMDDDHEKSFGSITTYSWHHQSNKNRNDSHSSNGDQEEGSKKEGPHSSHRRHNSYHPSPSKVSRKSKNSAVAPSSSPQSSKSAHSRSSRYSKEQQPLHKSKRTSSYSPDRSATPSVSSNDGPTRRSPKSSTHQHHHHHHHGYRRQRPHDEEEAPSTYHVRRSSQCYDIEVNDGDRHHDSNNDNDDGIRMKPRARSHSPRMEFRKSNSDASVPALRGKRSGSKTLTTNHSVRSTNKNSSGRIETHQSPCKSPRSKSKSSNGRNATTSSTVKSQHDRRQRRSTSPKNTSSSPSKHRRRSRSNSKDESSSHNSYSSPTRRGRRSVRSSSPALVANNAVTPLKSPSKRRMRTEISQKSYVPSKAHVEVRPCESEKIQHIVSRSLSPSGNRENQRLLRDDRFDSSTISSPSPLQPRRNPSKIDNDSQSVQSFDSSTDKSSLRHRERKDTINPKYRPQQRDYSGSIDWRGLSPRIHEASSLMESDLCQTDPLRNSEKSSDSQWADNSTISSSPSLRRQPPTKRYGTTVPSNHDSTNESDNGSKPLLTLIREWNNKQQQLEAKERNEIDCATVTTADDCNSDTHSSSMPPLSPIKSPSSSSSSSSKSRFRSRDQKKKRNHLKRG